MTFFVNSYVSRQSLCLDCQDFKNGGDLKEYLSCEKGVSREAFFLVCKSELVKDEDPLQKDAVYHSCLRQPGGKGGFGSMLRAIGAQIEKTTNHEACRDLSGRRMRDVNNEKDLKEWLGKQTEREREREQRRQERIARRRAMPNHRFEDPLYHEQRKLLAENQEDALQQGLKKAGPKPTASATVTSEEASSMKRKCEMQGPSTSQKKKKDIEWLGVDIDSLSDLDSDENTSDCGEDFQRGATLHEEAKQDFSKKSCVVESDSSTSGSVENKENSRVESCGSGKGSMENMNVICRIWTGSEEVVVKSEPTDDRLQDSEKDQVKVDNALVKGVKTEDIGECIAQDNRNRAVESEPVEHEDEKPFILENIDRVEDLEQLGLDRLKEELMSRGLKCGGTLQQRAERLFSVKGLSKEQIDPSLFAKTSDTKKIKNRK